MAPGAELRDADAIARWLALGLALRRAAPADEEAVAAAILACAHELPALPPPGVVADVAAVLAGAPLAAAPPAVADPDLRAALRAYDDDVLARLVRLPRFDDLRAAFAHAAPGDRGAAVALVVAAVCERAGFTGAVVSPAALRRALARPRDDASPDASTVAQLADAYHRLARGARQRRALIDDRDVRAVDHLGVLRDLGGRMTAAHLAAAAAAFAQRLPRRLAARRALRGAHASQLADDAHYPAGGFTAITPGGATTGNLANLVSSELVYMEDDDPVDAFALRFVEGELLHYTRDDSVLRRHRHVIAIALGAELAAARVKDRALPWQRLIVVLGLVIACVRWLVEQLAGPRDDQALTVRLAFPPAGLGDERPIVALLLGAEIARGVVVIVDEPWPATVAAIEAAAGAAIADLVVITHGDGPAMPRGVRGLRLEVAGPAPRVEAITVTDPTVARGGDPDGDPWHQWGNAAEDLLRWLA